jgi:hypothetical protein
MVRSEGGSEEPPPAAKEIRGLIDQLVSPNRKPKVQDGASAAMGLPRDFDRVKQQQVDRAISKLLQLGPQAFPFLISRWEDERYCLTACSSASGAFLHKTVGDICQAILFSQLQPYGYWPEGGYNPDRRPPAYRPRYPSTLLGSKEAAKRWWEKNKHKTLSQMQLEALDWVIAEEAKNPRKFKDEERKVLQQLRKKLVQGDKPLPAEHVGNYDGFDFDVYD